MRKLIVSTSMLMAALPGVSVWAADESVPVFDDSNYQVDSVEVNRIERNRVNPGQPGTSGEELTSTADTSQMKGGLMDEVVGIKPQAGVINYRDVGGSIGNRGLIGLTTEVNIATSIANVTGVDALKSVYIGPSTGLFFSHLGTGGSNFWGTNGTSSLGGEGANLFFVPANLKVGTNLGIVRVGLHGGANLFYRSVGNAIALGVNPDSNSDQSWSFLPNVGADVELGVTNAIGVVFRPDITFGGSNRVWSASLGASIPLG